MLIFIGLYGSWNVSLLLQHLADNVAMYMHAHTLYSAVRPFGCGVIIGTYDKQSGPAMYMIDPSGVYHVRIFVIETFNVIL